MIKPEFKIDEFASIEDQIRYYKKEYDAVLAEAERQCDIAADLAMKIMKLKEKLCRMTVSATNEVKELAGIQRKQKMLAKHSNGKVD